MDMLFGWSALRQNCYILKCSINLKWKQIPISLNSGSRHIAVSQRDILRRGYVPITIHILPRLQKEQNCQVKQVCLAQDAPTEASLSCGFATLLHLCVPEPGLDLHRDDAPPEHASSPLTELQHPSNIPPHVVPGLINEEIWQEKSKRFLCRDLSYSFIASLESGQNFTH